MIERAEINGLSQTHLDKLKSLVDSHIAIFRIDLTVDEPGDFTPLQIELIDSSNPLRVNLQDYSPEQKSFLLSFVPSAVEKGLAYRNSNSRWASALLIVPKPVPSKFRFTVYLRPVNKLTVQYLHLMPNVESQLSKLSKSKLFVSLTYRMDICNYLCMKISMSHSHL